MARFGSSAHSAAKPASSARSRHSAAPVWRARQQEGGRQRQRGQDDADPRRGRDRGELGAEAGEPRRHARDDVGHRRLAPAAEAAIAEARIEIGPFHHHGHRVCRRRLGRRQDRGEIAVEAGAAFDAPLRHQLGQARDEKGLQMERREATGELHRIGIGRSPAVLPDEVESVFQLHAWCSRRCGAKYRAARRQANAIGVQPAGAGAPKAASSWRSRAGAGR